MVAIQDSIELPSPVEAIAALPEGQLVPNEVVDAWLLKLLKDRPNLRAGQIEAAAPKEYFAPGGAYRGVDRALQRKRDKLRFVNHRWALAPGVKP